MEALGRLVASTWGPTARNTRILYSGIVRPTMLYGVAEWGMRLDGGAHAAHKLLPLKRTQNNGLHRITGGYKRTPVAALEQEAGIIPVDLYI